jgi:CheY-like chemotaxis protein
MLTDSRQVHMANILVVDDYWDTAQSMAMWLKCLGHDVQIASDGYQAIEVARRQRPNYVLLDLGLPRLDGYQVASRLRQELAGPLVRSSAPTNSVWKPKAIRGKPGHIKQRLPTSFRVPPAVIHAIHKSLQACS